ncbi:hypothetical protein CALCODRAFT_506479 [Calocera cornea HHB12733]|uniref:DUF6532 domain-containing protein n=1 Tax=Calocera cornea HHB12733 TaxID=1353952 RepID=A0A165IW93_9BASI|nr:hypothetical protein CALCODRAFT_506479 [Calocera cornea HHB12733]
MHVKSSKGVVTCNDDQESINYEDQAATRRSMTRLKRVAERSAQPQTSARRRPARFQTSREGVIPRNDDQILRESVSSTTEENQGVRTGKGSDPEHILFGDSASSIRISSLDIESDEWTDTDEVECRPIDRRRPVPSDGHRPAPRRGRGAKGLPTVHWHDETISPQCRPHKNSHSRRGVSQASYSGDNLKYRGLAGRKDAMTGDDGREDEPEDGPAQGPGPTQCDERYQRTAGVRSNHGNVKLPAAVPKGASSSSRMTDEFARLQFEVLTPKIVKTSSSTRRSTTRGVALAGCKGAQWARKAFKAACLDMGLEEHYFKDRFLRDSSYACQIQDIILQREAQLRGEVKTVAAELLLEHYKLPLSRGQDAIADAIEQFTTDSLFVYADHWCSISECEATEWCFKVSSERDSALSLH